MWVNEFWLFGTAIVFTAIGWYWGFKSNAIEIVESTIDSLIEQGYIKTQTGSNGEIELLKHTD